jgi:cytochrome c oxidase subunit 2
VVQRDWVRVTLVWVVLTAVGEFAVLRWDFMPLVLSEEGEEIDAAIGLLNVYSVPVMALVLAVAGYSIFAFRSRQRPDGDGAAITGEGAIPWVWFAVTTALAVLVFLNPGLTGLRSLQAQEPADVTIQIDAVQWHWDVTYPGAAKVEDAGELVLPLDQRVRIEMTSQDVIHSLWLPALRMKQDAVPGRVTTMEFTATKEGAFTDDPGVRVQCAELCGTGHPRMRMAVRIVEPSEFDSFVAGLPSEEGADGAGQDGMDMDEDEMDEDEMDMDEDEMDMEGSDG